MDVPSLYDIVALHNRLDLIGKLIYAVSEAVTPGKVLHCKETDWNYEYCIFHSEDEAASVAFAAGLDLLHVRDAPMKLPRKQHTF